jgi:SAM-dependent methyltransferase
MSTWQTIGVNRFDRDPPPDDEYLRLRYRVLFELWAPTQTSFIAEFLLCDHCGLVIYAPRPTADDIDGKYRFIAAQAPSDSRSRDIVATSLDRQRSRELYKSLLPYLGSRIGNRVLDFGGGSGSLLSAFTAAGFECNVVDYSTAVVPGVAHVGATLSDLDAGEKFDIALCSHVFEHVADPVETARELGDHLVPGGLILVEVPLEILGGPPAMREPVTHVNFFSDPALALTLARAGYEVLDCRTQACLVASGRYGFGIRAVARKAAIPTDSPLPGAKRARALIEMGTRSKIRLALANPRVPLSPLLALRRKLSPP